MSSTHIFISNWFDVCLWSNISKTMLLWNGLLVLFVLLAGFPWNMARPQLHLLSLTVKKLRCQASYFILRSPNLQYKTHPEFWPSHSRIFKTSLYYKTHLILETRRYIDTLDCRFIFYIDRQHKKSCSYINLSWVTYCENMFNISIIDYPNT